MKKTLVWAASIIAVIGILLSACLVLGYFSGILPRKDSAIASRFAAVNGLESSDVSVKVSYFTANYCEVEFKKLPPDGILRIGSSVESLEEAHGVLFLYIAVPGGDIARLLAHRDLSAITRSGDTPIRCGEAIVPAPGSGWTLDGFTMNDLNAIASALPALPDHLIIDLTPADGVVDWSVIARFPSIGWRFRKVTQWLNAETSAVSANFIVFYDKNVKLPQKLDCPKIYAKQCRELER